MYNFLKFLGGISMEKPVNQSTPTPETPKKNGLGVASLIVCITALAGSWVPLLNIFSIILGITGCLLGLWSLINVIFKKVKSPAISIISIVIGITAVCFSWSINDSAFNKNSNSNLVSSSNSEDNNSNNQSSEKASTTSGKNSSEETNKEYKIGDVINLNGTEISVAKINKN